MSMDTPLGSSAQRTDLVLDAASVEYLLCTAVFYLRCEPRPPVALSVCRMLCVCRLCSGRCDDLVRLFQEGLARSAIENDGCMRRLAPQRVSDNPEPTVHATHTYFPHITLTFDILSQSRRHATAILRSTSTCNDFVLCIDLPYGASRQRANYASSAESAPLIVGFAFCSILCAYAGISIPWRAKYWFQSACHLSSCSVE